MHKVNFKNFPRNLYGEIFSSISLLSQAVSKSKELKFGLPWDSTSVKTFTVIVPYPNVHLVSSAAFIYKYLSLFSILWPPLSKITLFSLKSTQSLDTLQTFYLSILLPSLPHLSPTPSKNDSSQNICISTGNDAKQVSSYFFLCFWVPPHAGLKVSPILCHLGAFFSEACLQLSILGRHLNSMDIVTLEGAWLRKTQTFYLNLGPGYIVTMCHWKHLGGLHKAQNWTLDSTGYMNRMKLQDKDLNAPAVRTIMGAVYIICLR